MSSVYGVFRVQKIKCSNGGGLAARLKHSTREVIAENIDENRSVFNSVEGAKTYAAAKKEISRLWETVDKRRSDSVGVIETMITTTGKLPKGDEKQFIELSKKQLKEMYGENIVSLFIHRDEKETHIHCFSVPLETKYVEKTRLSDEEKSNLKNRLKELNIEFQEVPKKPKKDAKPEEWEKYKSEKIAYDRYKTRIKPILKDLNISKKETTLSCQPIMGNREILRMWQDSWHKNVFSHFGLDRGELKKRGEKDKYKSPTSLKKWSENLKKLEKELVSAYENFNKNSDFLVPGKNENTQEYYKRIRFSLVGIMEELKKLKNWQDIYIKLTPSQLREVADFKQKELDQEKERALEKPEKTTMRLTKVENWREI